MKRKKTKSVVKIFRAAEELFQNNGISGVTVKEIYKLAGVSKMTFYRNFNSKEDLAFDIVKEIYSEAWKKITAIVEDNNSFEKKIKKIVAMKIELLKNYSSEFLADLTDSDIPRIAQFIRDQTERSLKMTREIFMEARKKGEIRPDIPIETITVIFNSMNSVFLKLHSLKYYQDSKENNVLEDLFKVLYLGILPRKKADKRKIEGKII